MEVFVIGVSHHTAPVAVREAMALPGDLARRLLRAVHSENVLEEAMVLDTCNRTEVYFVSRRPEDALEYLLGHIGRLKGIGPADDVPAFYRHDGPAAVAHLFRVAAALDSQIVGEHQILGQIKGAYRVALEERTARFFLNKLMHWAFRVGKRVRTETDLGRGSASVGQAAVDLACRTFTSLAGKSVMLVGAGKNAELAAKALLRRRVGRLIVANRSLARAEEMVGKLLESRPDGVPGARVGRRPGHGEGEPVRCPAALRAMGARGAGPREDSPPPPRRPQIQALELGQIPDVISQADLVISSTGAPGFVLTCDELSERVRRSGRPLLLVDLAVPRDVDPRLGELPNVSLHNMDDLDRLVAENIERRRGEIPRAEAVIERELGQFARWFDSLQVVPTVKLLKRHFASLEDAQIRRYRGRFSAGDRQQLQRFTRGLCNKILHSPIAFLHEVSAKGSFSDQLAAVDMVRRMFDLDGREHGE